jgi:hypothetical protein
MDPLMVSSKIKQLADAREKVARLELAIETELYEELFGLHSHYGFADVRAFLNAVRAAVRGGPRKTRKAGRPKKSAPPKSHKRAVITDSIRAKVKKLVEGGVPGSKIAKETGISRPSVQNVKKALGLVMARRLKPRPKPAKKRSIRKTAAKRAAPSAASEPAKPE